MKKIKRESLKKAEKGSGVYTMGSVYKLPDTWTPTFDLSNHEKVSARNDYAEKLLKKSCRRNRREKKWRSDAAEYAVFCQACR